MIATSKRATITLFCLFLLLSAVLAVDTWLTLPPTPTLPPADSSGLLDINGVQIWHALFSTHLASAGPTVVFLHGGLAHSAYHGPQVAKVAAHRQVLSIDSRGHGRSTRDSTPYSYELMESDVIAVMDHLGLTEVDLIGWSDGAIIGLVMARDHPSRLHSLFSFAANSNPTGVLDVMVSPVFTDYIDRARDEYAILSSTPGDYDGFLGNISGMWASQPDIRASDFAAMRSNASHPILIVHADHEEAIRRNDTLFMADSNTNFGLVILPRVSHFAFLQDPLTFDNAMMSWLHIDASCQASPISSPTSDSPRPWSHFSLSGALALIVCMFIVLVN